MISVRRARGLAVGWLLLLLLSCHGANGGAANGPHEQGRATVGGDVVSTVDGKPITVADVQQLVNASGLSPRAALSRLQSELLLMDEAARRGFAARSEVAQVARQAAVQALLAQDVELASPSEAEVAAFYEQVRKERFETPEKRAAVHVLARLPKKPTGEQELAARTFAETACKELAAASDLPATLRALQTRSMPNVQVIVEQIPPVDRDASIAQEFLAALFAAPKLGVLPAPVRTSFGWHTIVLTDIEAKQVVPLSTVHAELVTELQTKQREGRLNGLLQKLRSDTAVAYEGKGREPLEKLEL